MLDGQLVEGAPPEDEVHLANLDEDMGEKNNLKDAEPALTEELKRSAEGWRANIEDRWEQEFLPKAEGTVTH